MYHSCKRVIVAVVPQLGEQAALLCSIPTLDVSKNLAVLILIYPGP